jgi:hypothetical protein
LDIAACDKQEDALDLRQMTDDLRERPGDDLKFPGPIRDFVRPAQPSGFVRFPFGGHAEAL